MYTEAETSEKRRTASENREYKVGLDVQLILSDNKVNRISSRQLIRQRRALFFCFFLSVSLGKPLVHFITQ